MIESQAQAAITARARSLLGPQTLILAKMLNGLCNLLLAEFGSTTGT